MSDAPMENSRLQRKKALRRAAAATMAALVLMLGVLMMEDQRETVPATIPDPAQAPVLTPANAPAPADAVPEIGTDRLSPALSTSPLAGSETAAPAVSEPPPAPVEVAAEPAESVPAAKAPVPLPDGYLVQLGVFGAMDNAAALHADIIARGLPARVEGRVVVGPFPSKAAAQAAQAQLRRDGVGAGFVVPPRKDR